MVETFGYTKHIFDFSGEVSRENFLMNKKFVFSYLTGEKIKSKIRLPLFLQKKIFKMDSYSESYQNGGSRREADLQGLSQNIGTNIQKILQNGK